MTTNEAKAEQGSQNKPASAVPLIASRKQSGFDHSSIRRLLCEEPVKTGPGVILVSARRKSLLLHAIESAGCHWPCWGAKPMP